MLRIVLIESIGIDKNGGSFLKGNAVFLEVTQSFLGVQENTFMYIR